MKKSIFRAAAMAAIMAFSTMLAGQTQAQTVMDCTMTDLPRTGAATSRYFFSYDTANNRVVVMDEVTLIVAKTPVSAKITRSTDERLSFNWTVRQIPMKDSRTGAVRDHRDFSFKATYFKKQKRLMVRSYSGAHAFDAANGNCVPGKLPRGMR